MSEAQAETNRQPDPPDPIQQFREMRDAYLDIWSKSLIDAVNTEGYAQASGAAVNNYLNVAAPYKEAAEQAMLRTLQQLNMPSSVDFAGLAGRITNIEMQLDNLDAKLDRIERVLAVALAAAGSAAAEPAPVTANKGAPNGSAAQTTPAPESTETPSAPAAIRSTPAAIQAKSRKAQNPSSQEETGPKATGKSNPKATPLRRNPRKGAK